MSLFPHYSMTNTPLIQTENLTLGYEGKTIVQGINLTVPWGGTLALVGGNGSGKTTLLKTLAGLIPPISGKIQIFGKDPKDAVKSLAWLGQFQNTNPLLPLRVRDVVRMSCYPARGLLGSITKEDEKVVDEAMEFFGTTFLANKSVGELSGGQRQRVYLSYVLARRAPLVLLDEPVSNLDAEGMKQYSLMIQNFVKAGTAVVVATHNLQEASQYNQVLDINAQLA